MKRSAPGASPGLLVFFLAGCGGGVPLFHPAHVLPPGEVRAGAGLSGQVPLLSLSSAEDSAGLEKGGQLQQLAVAPGIAPWVGGRVGIEGDNEGGLTYSGRTIRVDGRHAFSVRGGTLSVGLGASAIVAQRPSEKDSNTSVFGGGLDIPVLFGMKSASDLYALWLGPRVGMEFLAGRWSNGSIPPSDVTVRHFFGGFVAGFRVGFRHVHVAIELDSAYHRIDGGGEGSSFGLNQLSLTPGGALLIAF